MHQHAEFVTGVYWLIHEDDSYEKVQMVEPSNLFPRAQFMMKSSNCWQDPDAPQWERCGFHQVKEGTEQEIADYISDIKEFQKISEKVAMEIGKLLGFD